MSVELRVDFCSHEAAKYAVEHWHYSKVMPAGKTVKFGVWEDGKFIGAIVFSWGANNHIGSPYNLKMIEVCELVRVAFNGHTSPVSQIISVSLRLLVKQSPGLRLIVSYADPEQGHTGAIYQAMNWIYTGPTRPQRESLRPSGAILHKRTAHSLYGTIDGLPKSKILWKHKYLYPLDRAMRKQIRPLAKPYPKRDLCGLGEIDNAPGSNRETGGASPTSPLNKAPALVSG